MSFPPSPSSIDRGRLAKGAAELSVWLVTEWTCWSPPYKTMVTAIGSFCKPSLWMNEVVAAASPAPCLGFGSASRGDVVDVGNGERGEN